MDGHHSSVAIRLISYTEIIDFILEQQNVTTTMVVCASRAAFLAQLQGELHRTDAAHLANSDERIDHLPSNTLLNPRLHLLATSKRVRLAFTPTLPHLRAYLAAINPPSYSTPPSLEGQPTLILVILDLVSLHRQTSEFSTQGISRTLAIAVEAAELARMKLVLAEHRDEDDRDDIDGVNDGTSGALNYTRQDPWKECMPLLSGSVRFGNDEALRAGMTIKVGNVLARWCKFRTLDTIFSRESDTQLD